MKSVNRIELKGVVGQDARINKAGGRSVGNFSLATEFAWIDREGAQQKETEWHNVVAWEGYGITDLSRIVKGAKVYVTGRLRSRKYNDNQGNQRYVTEVIAEELDIIDEQPRQQQHVGNTSGQTRGAATRQQQADDEDF